MGSNTNTGFSSLEERWSEKLQESGDITCHIHLDLFRELALGAVENGWNIPEERFYFQENAGFLRFRVIEVTDQLGNRFQVNFHVFPVSQTHIHAHGYEAHSFVLDGELVYSSFTPERLNRDQQESLRNAYKAFYDEGERPGDTLRIKREISCDMEKLLRGETVDEFSYRTLLHSSMLGGLGIYGDLSVAEKYVGGPWWFRPNGFEKPNEMMHIVQQKGVFHRLTPKESRYVAGGEGYQVGLNEAHSVGVREDATKTLFLTKRPPNASSVAGGDFHHFPEIHRQTSKVSEALGRRNPKDETLIALKEILEGGR